MRERKYTLPTRTLYLGCLMRRVCHRPRPRGRDEWSPVQGNMGAILGRSWGGTGATLGQDQKDERQDVGGSDGEQRETDTEGSGVAPRLTFNGHLPHDLPHRIG